MSRRYCDPRELQRADIGYYLPNSYNPCMFRTCGRQNVTEIQRDRKQHEVATRIAE